MKKLFTLLLLVLTVPCYAAGGATKFDNKAPVELAADSLEVLQKDALALFKGNVVVKQAGIEIRANEMKVYYGGSASGASSASGQKIQKIEVAGGVFIRRAGETAQGDLGVYDVSSGVIVLTGNVTLTKQNNIIKGASLSIDLQKGQSKIVNDAASGGRVRGLFVPQ